MLAAVPAWKLDYLLSWRAVRYGRWHGWEAGSGGGPSGNTLVVWEDWEGIAQPLPTITSLWALYIGRSSTHWVTQMSQIICFGLGESEETYAERTIDDHYPAKVNTGSFIFKFEQFFVL